MIFQKLNKVVTCADGFRISIQASETHYCTPRIDGAERYTEVEVGFPSEAEACLMPYAEMAEAPTETVYGWVPVSIVSLLLAKHGGIVEGTVPNGVPELRVINKDKTSKEK
jgi:hypothetical protein|tara:strand:+ start:235 stop:567 length:333 start_codon:yes stop_codon:yes gene_type:complete